MAKNLHLGDSYAILCLFVLWWCCSFGRGSSLEDDGSRPYNSFTASSFSYPQMKLEPYAWRYIRVDLPPWFSSFSIALESDVDLDVESIGKLPKSKMPIICLQDGSPPLPDVANTSTKTLVSHPVFNGTFGGIQGHPNLEQCYPLQKNITVKLTNEQISSGVWYLGLFNGIGPMRTQSKMITRGPAFSFTANISVEGCTTPTMWGPYCNRTIEPLSCAPSGNNSFTRTLSDAQSYNRSVGNVVYCSNSLVNSCNEGGDPKVYSVEVMGMIEQLTITAINARFNEVPPSSKTVNASEFQLMCFVRRGAIPLATLHDYAGNIDKSPLVISSPKLGRWYISILPVGTSNKIGQTQDTRIDVCYTLKWKVLGCPEGRAGLNCTWETYMLQTFLRKDPTAPFESYYLPVSKKAYTDSANFPIEPFLSNFSSMGDLDDVWTYFLLEVPRGAAGGNFHIRLTPNARMHYEMYARFGGLPSVHNWDYFYANKTSGSSGTMFGKLYNSSEETIDFYIFYVREGTWSFGLRRLNLNGSTSEGQTAMSISLERCPKKCSSHGACRSVVDTSGLTLYSYCSCDRDHGGFDCSVEIISHRGHVWQSVALIASNAAAILPAYWALRKKAFAEWVLFTSSGISSGLYHACDVGTWCALNFHPLQFMDFWLSFMAVVSTFIYLTSIDEVSKRTIHTGVSILTALMAATGATRSANIILVIAIGASGLIIGWMMEFTTNYRSFAFSMGFCLNIHDRWQVISRWVHNLVKTLIRRFHWGFILAGFIALAMAGISRKLETAQTYWIWHSAWHVSIYTSSFFFLCSKAAIVDASENEPPVDRNYELARQNSFSRGE